MRETAGDKWLRRGSSALINKIILVEKKEKTKRVTLLRTISEYEILFVNNYYCFVRGEKVIRFARRITSSVRAFDSRLFRGNLRNRLASEHGALGTPTREQRRAKEIQRFSLYSHGDNNYSTTKRIMNPFAITSSGELFRESFEQVYNIHRLYVNPMWLGDFSVTKS